MKRLLLVRNPDGSILEFPFDKPSIQIGRSPGNDIVLRDADRSVSRRHAMITGQVGGAVTIVDLKSANGTSVNGRPISQPVELTPNDVIKIGQFQVTLREEIPEDSRFNIKAGTVGLEDLQKEPAALPNAARGADMSHLELLYEVGVKLAGSRSVEDVTRAAIDLLFKIKEVHRATMMLWDPERKEFNSLGLNMRGGGQTGFLPESYNPANLVMSRTILNRVRQQNVPLLIRDAKADSMLDGSASIVRAGIQAAFCSPLSFQGQFLGILYGDNLAEPDAFSDADFMTFTAIASQTGLALANAISGQKLRQRETERQALRQYLPPQVADLILASGGASQLRGILQPVTVLYADIRGFTTLSTQMEAPEIVEMLSEFFTEMSAVILRCNGTLDKFIGDCIMALFGAPVSSPTASRDALRAAIEMQEAMATLNRKRIDRHAPPFEIGIGLHCGPAVVGNIGSADRVQYTAIGDTVNIASRLVSKAQATQIIVSQDILEAIPDYGGFAALGDVELKGRSGTTAIALARWSDVPLA